MPPPTLCCKRPRLAAEGREAELDRREVHQIEELLAELMKLREVNAAAEANHRKGQCAHKARAREARIAELTKQRDASMLSAARCLAWLARPARVRGGALWLEPRTPWPLPLAAHSSQVAVKA